MGKKYTIKEVKKIFKKGGCKLLATEYVNCKTKMKYICNCKREAEITLDTFKRGKRCKECAKERIAAKLRFSYEDVKEIFEKGGCILISKKYINNETKLEYECNCGRTAWISLSSFQRGRRCYKCGIKKIIIKKRYTLEQVKKIFENGGCKLLETVYKGSKIKMEYICNCRRTAWITLSDFQSGRRCKKCAIERISGKNHYRYNFDLTEEEREIGRNYPEYDKWRKDVYERDNFTCCITGKRGGDLVVHHLDSYDNNKELRIILSNGITISEEYHKLFHKIYGMGNNTREQFEEFLKNNSHSLI